MLLLTWWLVGRYGGGAGHPPPRGDCRVVFSAQIARGVPGNPVSNLEKPHGFCQHQACLQSCLCWPDALSIPTEGHSLTFSLTLLN